MYGFPDKCPAIFTFVTKCLMSALVVLCLYFPVISFSCWSQFPQGYRSCLLTQANQTRLVFSVDCTEMNPFSQAHIHWLEIRYGLHHKPVTDAFPKPALCTPNASRLVLSIIQEKQSENKTLQLSMCLNPIETNLICHKMIYTSAHHFLKRTLSKVTKNSLLKGEFSFVPFKWHCNKQDCSIFFG